MVLGTDAGLTSQQASQRHPGQAICWSICFVLGLGIWSGFAPLESAAIASGVVELEFEPQDDSAP